LEQRVKNFAGYFVLLAGLLPAAAAAQNQQVSIFGFEDASCAAWSKSVGNRAIRMQYEFWIRGFVSGHNYGNPSLQVAVGALPGGDALHAYLDQYCRDQPKATFIGGAIALVQQLRQPVAPSPPPAAKKTPESQQKAK
jgi:hypothetical protein